MSDHEIMAINKPSNSSMDSATDFVIKALSRTKKADANAFPVEVFPRVVKRYIEESKKTLNYPVEYTSCSVLFSAAVAIGNTRYVKLKEGWIEPCMLWFALVGNAGVGKTHPLKNTLAPFQEIDKESYIQYQREMDIFTETLSLNKKEREDIGIEKPKKPELMQCIVQDITIESLFRVLQVNARGVGGYMEELSSMVNNFDRYNKGSDQEYFLTMWSGGSIRVNRKTSEPIFIERPFVSIAGTIQPTTLVKSMNGRTENGFIDRILFSYPDGLKKEHWNDQQINPNTIDDWTKVIKRLVEIPLTKDGSGGAVPEIMELTEEAKQSYVDWNAELVELINKSESDVIKSMLSKMESYTIRLSLILEMLYWSCSEVAGSRLDDDPYSIHLSISERAIDGAIKLARYFIENGSRVRAMFTEITEFDRLPSMDQEFYDTLPVEFTTEEAVMIGGTYDKSPRTVKSLLSKKNLFDRFKHGNYRKLL